MQDKTPGPDEAAAARELEEAIEHCLADLEEKFRVVMVLVDISGEDYESVSAIINRPMGTVKSRLARARQKMQDCLRGFEELLPDKFRLKDEDTE